MSTIFGPESTTDDVLAGMNLSGKRALVTGVGAALGIETARALAAHGATVIGGDGDLEAARSATAGIGSLELVAFDHASLASVRACADGLIAQGEPIDLVICTGGIVACPEGRTADGFETQFAINHLAPFVLVNRIAPLLAPGARVVLVSSPAHRMGDVDLDDPNFERTPYDIWLSYGRSSTAKILFAVEFDRRHAGRGIRAASAQPGAVRTELSRHVRPAIQAMNASSDGPPMQWKTIPQGAATAIWAGLVADADEIGGRYCEDCHVAEIVEDREARSGVQSFAVDPERARALWTKSEEMVGERF